MRCSKCGSENPDGNRFCGDCGAPLTTRCLHCGSDSPPGKRFCGACGTALIGGTPASVADISSGLTSVSGERRHLTVLFCDLVGSTEIAARLDPEEWRELVAGYHRAAADAITRFGGYVAKYLGDGVMALFGYPEAHDNDAERAARAGLALLDALSKLNGQARHSRLIARVGVDSGVVVVGAGAGKEVDVFGDVPNIAARVQSAAEPGAILITDAVHHLVAGLFVVESCGAPVLKGIERPLQLYKLVEPSGVRGRLEAAAVARGLTPFVGREDELRLLINRWEHARDGEGQVVLIIGEAGIGKSRLLQALKERGTEEAYAKVECHCSPYTQNSAFYPLIEHLHRLLEWRRKETPGEKLDKLERILASYGLPLLEVVPLLAALLSLPLPERYPPLTLTPQRQKQKTLEALIAWLLKEAERQPVRFFMEDLHWADPSTLEFLSILIDQVPTVRLFVVLTFRPEFLSPWAIRSHMAQLTLSRLSREQVEMMVGTVTGGKMLPPEVVQQVVAKTDGVPLFVEELTKMVLESGLLREENGRYVAAYDRASLPPLAIPATLQDSLMARLDRLATVREVAQLGATLGREFSYELIHAVWPLDEEALHNGLSQLVEAELLYQKGLLPQARYIFKHALIQDAAYQSLLKSTRQQYHQQTAQVLEGRFPETAETQPELLAHHYTEAGLREQAIFYWQRAGERAIARSDNEEAIGHLRKGLELLNALPDTPERVQQKLTLQVTLGAALMATKGYAAPEVEKVYAQARELCQQLGETPLLARVLGGMEAFYFVRGDLQTAHELGEQLLHLAQSVHDQTLFLRAHTAMGLALFHLGEFASAREHLEQGIALHDSQDHRSRALQDPGVVFLSYGALTLWHLGYAEQVQKRIDEALALAGELSHPYSLTLALYFSTWIHQFRREAQAAQERAQALIELATEQGFSLLLVMGTILQGWARAEQGQGEEGIAQMRQGLVALRATGAELFRPWYLALLAEAYAKVGQAEEGLAVLAEALDIVNKNREHLYEAELYRLKGQLTLQFRNLADNSPNRRHAIEGDQSETDAEVCFRRAIEIAQQQSAKSWELRATISLAQLLAQQGRRDEARMTLAEIYRWFTEGFDTADLKEAKALLDELSL